MWDFAAPSLGSRFGSVFEDVLWGIQAWIAVRQIGLRSDLRGHALQGLNAVNRRPDRARVPSASPKSGGPGARLRCRSVLEFIYKASIIIGQPVLLQN
jgi:hypothetical protein